jgi:hypothetical protein
VGRSAELRVRLGQVLLRDRAFPRAGERRRRRRCGNHPGDDTGRIGISNVVPSAARRLPVVAVAVPYQTPVGRRVFSGALNLEDTPLASYLRNYTSIQGSWAYLIDARGTPITGEQGARVTLTQKPVRRGGGSEGRWTGLSVASSQPSKPGACEHGANISPSTPVLCSPPREAVIRPHRRDRVDLRGRRRPRVPPQNLSGKEGVQGSSP